MWVVGLGGRVLVAVVEISVVCDTAAQAVKKV
jgi:hypothetical protein